VRQRGLDLSGSKCSPELGSCEHGNEHSGFMKRGEYGTVKLSASQGPLSSMEAINSVTGIRQRLRNTRTYLTRDANPVRPS
jgi:hypothetical protein